MLADSSFEGESACPAEEDLLRRSASPVMICSLTIATKPVIIETLSLGWEKAPCVVMSSSSTSKGNVDPESDDVGMIWTGRPAQALVLKM